MITELISMHFLCVRCLFELTLHVVTYHVVVLLTFQQHFNFFSSVTFSLIIVVVVVVVFIFVIEDDSREAYN